MMNEEYLETYINLVDEEADEWLRENVEDYDNFDYAWDDMCMSVTGNDGGYVNSLDKEAILHIVWLDDFHRYCEDMCADIGSILSSIETADCYIRYMILEYYLYNKLERKWRSVYETKEVGD